MILILAYIAAILQVAQDHIQHYDSLKSWGYYFSRDAYHNAKYKFMIEYPKLPKWIVLNLLVIGLDFWHTCRMLMVFTFFAMVLLYAGWFIALFAFVVYQIGFIIFYNIIKW